MSGSSIQEKEDCARVERVGMGPCGLMSFGGGFGFVGGGDCVVVGGAGVPGVGSWFELTVGLGSGRSVSILSAASAASSAWGFSSSGGGTPGGDFETGDGPRDDSVDLVSSTAEEVMTTGVVSSATVGERSSFGDMDSLLIAGRSSSESGMVESSRQVFTNWTLAAASSSASMFLSLSPSRREVASCLRLVIDSSSMAASCWFLLSSKATARWGWSSEVLASGVEPRSLLPGLRDSWKPWTLRRISPMASLTAWLMPSFSLRSIMPLAAP